MTWEILRLFVNTLTANDKYSFLNRGNLTQPIQMHLSQKQKGVSQLFSAFFKSTLHFEHFRKKMTLITYVFPKLRTPENVVKYMSKKSRFRGPLDRQLGKRAQTLIQYQRQHLYTIH